MEFKGSKGKWTIDPQIGINEYSVPYLAIDCIVENEHMEAGEQEIINIFGKDKDSIKMKANAQLISKAPELLIMLKRAVDEINHLKYEYKDSGHARKFLKEAQKLIKETIDIN